MIRGKATSKKMKDWVGRDIALHVLSTKGDLCVVF